MAKTFMSLGAYTFPKNPSSAPVIVAKRNIAIRKTFTGYASFSWGVDLAGQEIKLEWRLMSLDMFDQIEAMLLADQTFVLDPNDGSGNSFNVEIIDLQADMFIKLASGYRQNVILSLKVLSQVV